MAARKGRHGRRRFDPIDLEVLWNRLITVVDEAAYAVIRTSMSKVVVEGRDFSAMLFDPRGRQLAADVSIASKSGHRLRQRPRAAQDLYAREPVPGRYAGHQQPVVH